MSQYNVLMLSSSRAGNGGYLETAKTLIHKHLDNLKSMLFIPYAGVTVSFDDYTSLVAKALPQYNIQGIHTFSDPLTAVQQADAVMVGGGNTFALLQRLYQQNLIAALQQRLAEGLPYIGWSAGSNICGASICTTNDMPIVEPPSFKALNILPFQLNPHYSNYIAPGHNGETRDQRLAEFTELHSNIPVIGIQEGSALTLRYGKLCLNGDLPAYQFLAKSKTELAAGSDLSHLL